MLKLANGLDRNHFDVCIVVLEETGPRRGDVASHIPVYNLNRPRVRTALLSLRRILKRLSPAIVVTTMGYLNLSVLIACRFGFSETRFIVREANDPNATLKAFRYPGLIRTLYKRLYPRAHAVVCPSQAILEHLAIEFAIPSDQLHLLRNPVDVTKIRTMADEPMPPFGGVTFVASGRLMEQKGFDRLLTMFAELPERARLWILGDGPLLAQLQNQASELKISDRVEFIGFRENPWKFYAAADSFLLPSRWEGMPNAALEALTCGTPVIATPESGGISEVAALAWKGAVQVVAAGEPFTTAMHAVTQCSEARPRPSLLPEVFLPPVVEREFTQLLVHDASG